MDSLIARMNRAAEEGLTVTQAGGVDLPGPPFPGHELEDGPVRSHTGSFNASANHTGIEIRIELMLWRGDDAEEVTAKMLGKIRDALIGER